MLKTQANPGYLEVIELDRLNEEKIKDLFNSCSCMHKSYWHFI